MMVGSGQGGGACATVPGNRTGGCGGQQRRGMSLGDAIIGVVVLGAATVNAVGVEVVDAGQVRVSMFVFGLVEQWFPGGGLVPYGLLPVVSHGYRCLRSRSRGRDRCRCRGRRGPREV